MRNHTQALCIVVIVAQIMSLQGIKLKSPHDIKLNISVLCYGNINSLPQSKISIFKKLKVIELCHILTHDQEETNSAFY